MPKLFEVPNKEKNYQSYMVYALAIIWSVVTVVIVSVGFYFFPQNWLRWLLFLGVSVLIAVFNISLNHFGYTRLASWSLTIMLWLFISIPCYSAGGILAPGILMQISLILTAGFLLGWRGGMALGLLTIVADFGLVYLELNGRLPAPSVLHSPVTRWISAIIPFGTTLALQYYATNHLRSALIAMQREMLKREEAEKVKDRTLYELGERIKELKTLYWVSRVLQDEDATHQKLISKIVEVLPSGWQHTDITAARISVNDTEFTTHNYRPSVYSQQAEMRTASGTNVSIEVVYLQRMPDADEGPFLKEERNLINMLVEMLKIDLERRERKSELKDYKYALDIASLVSISGVDGNFLFVNENYCRASKYNPEELTGKHHSIIWSGLHPPQYFEELKISMQNGLPFSGEFCNKAKDDSLYWVDTTIVPFLDESGKVYQYLSINYDITNRKKAETELKQSEEKFRSLVEQSLVGVFILQEDQFKYINPGFEKMIGYPKEKLLNDFSPDQLIHEDDSDRIRKEYLMARFEPLPKQEIFKAIRSDGVIIYLEAIISEIVYNNKPALIGTLVDITDRMEEEKRIAKAVIDAQENERLQIGMELHDNVKQILSASSLTLNVVISKIEDKNTALGLITNVIGYINDAADELRRLSHQLAPSVDNSISLAEKINSLVKNMNSNNHLNISVTIDNKWLSEGKNIPLTFYRILQEQLSNIIKHAKATNAEINIRSNEQYAILMIKDNGQGFDVNEPKSGIGLQNIRRRVQVSGGQLLINSTPGNGCEILVEIPLACLGSF